VSHPASTRAEADLAEFSGFKGGSTPLAGSLNRLNGIPDGMSVVPVPLAPGVGAVPGPSGLLGNGDGAIGDGLISMPAMVGVVLPFGKAREVAEVVVERISIDMVNVMPCWNGSTGSDPDGSMQVGIAPREVSAAASVVPPVRGVVGVGVAPVGDAAKDDDVTFHVSIISHGVSSPIGTNPR